MWTVSANFSIVNTSIAYLVSKFIYLNTFRSVLRYLSLNFEQNTCSYLPFGSSSPKFGLEPLLNPTRVLIQALEDMYGVRAVTQICDTHIYHANPVHVLYSSYTSWKVGISVSIAKLSVNLIYYASIYTCLCNALSANSKPDFTRRGGSLKFCNVLAMSMCNRSALQS
jgi:hypothetical protein